MKMAGEAGAMKALALTGRRLVRRADGWAVIGGRDRRSRAVAEVEADAARRLVASGRVAPAQGNGYVLSERAEPAAAPGPGVLAAAGRPRSRRSGAGFVGLAWRAAEGAGPLSARQAEAGLRLVRDTESAGRDATLSMAWDAIPADRGPRSSGRGGLGGAARQAGLRLRRVRSRAGEWAYALAWAACVDGRTLEDMETKFGLARRTGAALLARALEEVASAYEG
jgi:hypothetical protein